MPKISKTLLDFVTLVTVDDEQLQNLITSWFCIKAFVVVFIQKDNVIRLSATGLSGFTEV